MGTLKVIDDWASSPDSIPPLILKISSDRSRGVEKSQGSRWQLDGAVPRVAGGSRRGGMILIWRHTAAFRAIISPLTEHVKE